MNSSKTPLWKYVTVREKSSFIRKAVLSNHFLMRIATIGEQYVKDIETTFHLALHFILFEC